MVIQQVFSAADMPDRTVFFHPFGDEFFHFHRIFDFLEREVLHTLVGGMHSDRTDAEKALSQRTEHFKVEDAVELDFLLCLLFLSDADQGNPLRFSLIDIADGFRHTAEWSENLAVAVDVVCGIFFIFL